MPFDIHEALAAHGHQLPTPAAPAANYVPWRKNGGLLFISGQLPFIGAHKITGKVEVDLAVSEVVRGAQMCALNLLAHIDAAVEGNWDDLIQVVQLTGFVNCLPDYHDHPTIINGASNLIGDVLGERGKHTRYALGAVALPFDAAVEIGMIAAVK